MGDDGSRDVSDPIWTDNKWYVRADRGSEPIGPVSLDQIRRGLELGKIPAKAEIAEQGDDLWMYAVDAVGLARRTPRSTETKEHPLPPAPGGPAKKPRTTLLAVAAIALLPLLGGVGTGWYYLFGPGARPSKALPIVAQKLPGQTSLVTESRIRSDLDELAQVPEPYLASALAEIACGGRDVARLLAQARGKDLEQLQALGVLDLVANKKHQVALQCGELVRKSLVDNSQVEVTFTDGDKDREVSIIRSSMQSLAGKHFIRHSFSGLEGYCAQGTGEKQGCVDQGHAGFHDGELWVLGELESVEAFGRSYTTAHEEVTTNVEILEQLTHELRGADHTVVLARPTKIPWTAPCLRAAPVAKEAEFVKACFPEGQERVLESIETKVRGLGIERDVVAKAAAVRSTYILLARDEEAATAIEKDLADLKRDWRAHLTNNEPALIKMLREPSDYVHDRFWETVLDPVLRGLRAIEVHRSGSVVRWVMEEPLRPPEAKMLQEFLKTRTVDQAATIAVLEALIGGTAVREQSLAVFVGADVAAWIVAPRATKEDCGAILTHIRKLGENVPAEYDGLKTSLEEGYAEGKCVGMVLPLAFNKCLLSAGTLQQLPECRMLRSPFAAQAAKQLKGQWSVDKVNIAEGTRTPYGFSRAAQNCLLEVNDKELAFQCLQERNRTALRVRSSTLSHAIVAIPFKDGVSDRTLKFVDEDTLEMPSVRSGVSFTFKRAKFRRSLFESPEE